MQAVYGSYNFEANANHVLIRRDYTLNAAGIPYEEVLEVDIEGYLSGSGQANLSDAEGELVTAMRKPFKDFTFKRDDGGRTGIFLQDSSSLSGVRCTKGPSFTSKVGAEYANQRTFQLTIAATYPIISADTRYINFKERMQYSGGEAEYDYKDAINEESQLQKLVYKKPYTLIQSGEAFGFLDYPPAPPLAFPDCRMKAPEIEKIAPDRVGRKYKNYGIRWTYIMKSNAPLVAVPTLWRVGE